jgi:microcystin-dependent protein
MSIFGSGHEVVTSTTRPATATIGQIIFETDTLSYRWYNGTAWEGVTPVGTIQPFASATPPSGWEFCNGTILNSVANTKYAALFVAIGTTYGGSGASSFNVPNLAGRIPVGAGTQAQNGANGTGVISGGTTVARTIGQWFGDVYLQSHTHTFTASNSGNTGGESSAHIHGFDPRSAAGWNSGATQLVINGGSQYWGLRSTANNGDGGTVGQTYNNNVGHSHTFGGTVGAHNQTAGAQQNLQPSVVTNYIIKI